MDEWKSKQDEYLLKDTSPLGRVSFPEIIGLWCLRMGHVGTKNRSRGQMLGKPCARSRGHIFSPIIMKLGQIVFLDKISDEIENGSCWVKN